MACSGGVFAISPESPETQDTQPSRLLMPQPKPLYQIILVEIGCTSIFWESGVVPVPVFAIPVTVTPEGVGPSTHVTAAEACPDRSSASTAQPNAKRMFMCSPCALPYASASELP